MNIVQTARLRLRRLEAGDADFLVALMTDPDYLTHIGDRGLRTRAQAEAYISDVIGASYARHGYGMYLVHLRGSGLPVGIAGLVNRAGLNDVDIGFAVARCFRGDGYATEAAAGVLEHAVRDFALERIAGIVSPANAGSIRVLEKLGLRYEGRVRLAPGEAPVLLYARDLRGFVAPCAGPPAPGS